MFKYKKIHNLHVKYKIPQRAVVLEIIISHLEKDKIIHSQTELHKYVKEDLKKIDEDFAITPSRMRKIALKSGKVHVEISYKKTLFDSYGTKKCPICGHKVNDIINRTIEGLVTNTGYKCSFCNYWTGTKKRTPMKYVFSLLN